MRPYLGQIVLYRSLHSPSRIPCVIVELLGGTLVDLRNFRDLSYLKNIELKGTTSESFGYWEPLPGEVD